MRGYSLRGVIATVCACGSPTAGVPLAGVAARAVAGPGAVFTAICLATGSLWGRPTWGTWWQWDGRLTSMLVLLFLYGGYVALARADAERSTDGRVTAIFGLVGAVNLPMAELLAPDGTFLQPDEVSRRAAAVGVHRDTPVGTSCGSGVTAAQMALALHTAGIEAIPYIGSWSEWIEDPSRPVATQ